MAKIAIVLDTTTYNSEVLKKSSDVYFVPIQVLVNQEVYLDQMTIKTPQLNDFLSDPSNKISTSQPAIGDVITVMQEIKQKQYDHVFVLSLSGSLSGTLNGFQLAQQEVGIENIDIIDTKTICGPITEMAEFVLANKDCLTLDQMRTRIHEMMQHTESYVYPSSLQRLILSGRLNKAVGTFASLLKLRILLALKNNGENVEKLDIFRTEKKLIHEMVLHAKNRIDDQHKWAFYILECDGKHLEPQLIAKIQELCPQVEIKITDLPAAISTHVGLNTIALQVALIG